MHPPPDVQSEDEDNEFYDAQEEGGSIAEESSFILKIPVSHSRNSNDGSSSEGEDEENSETQQVGYVIYIFDESHLTCLCIGKAKIPVLLSRRAFTQSATCACK